MLSLPHLVVLFIVALLVFGPQKLPELARMLGKATAEFRKMTNDFRYALEDEVRELERQTRIREAEAFRSNEATVAEAPPSPPENTMPRESPAAEAPVHSELEQPAKASPEPEQPAAPQVVNAPQEKPSDDNTAV